MTHVLIVGDGLFGTSAALALAERGWTVHVTVRDVDAPRASAGRSRAVRAAYGTDKMYEELALLARAQWMSLTPNEYFDVGALLEGTLATRGTESTIPKGITWSKGTVMLDREAGWVDAEKACAALKARAESKGAVWLTGGKGDVVSEVRDGHVVCRNGTVLSADHVVLACGASIGRLAPHLASFFVMKALPLMFWTPGNEQDKEELAKMPVWMANIDQSGFYGFPLHPELGHAKMGFHGCGYPIPTEHVTQRVLEELTALVSDVEKARFMAFAASFLPSVERATDIYIELCGYCDTPDGDFCIDRDPKHSKVTIACGGSGHGAKFAPVLGEIIANKVEGVEGVPALQAAQERFGRLRDRLAAVGTVFQGDASRSALPVAGDRASLVALAIERSKF